MIYKCFKFFFLLFLIKSMLKKIESVAARFLHNDIKVPNFDDYRNSYTENASQSSKEFADDKQTYSYISTFGKNSNKIY